MQTGWSDQCRRLSVLRTIGNPLTWQLLEGVRVVHEHKVAHLDLNPANMVIADQTTSTYRLHLRSI